MPQKEQDQRHHAGFQHPDRHGAQAAEHSMTAADLPEEQSGRRQDADRHQPKGPRRQEDERPLMKNAERIFEEDFKHEYR
jgi:hypothetical protein